jgi:FixJ family two-component response regulator
MRRVAVVDDDPAVRRALARLLRSADYSVETFNSGTQFLKDGDEGAFECVVLDLHMPHTTGVDVQITLAQRGSALPVVVITGEDSSEARSRCLSLGAARYLKKPVDEAVLLDAIDAATGAPSDSQTSRS